MVYSLALRITGDPSLAEEVAEHVFLDLHARLSDAHPPDPILQWLRTATVRRALERTADFRPPQRPAGPEHQPESTPGDPFLSRHLRHLVAALPVTPRTVIALRFQEDRSPEEIAEILDLPAATVKSHLRRTLRLLHARADRLLKGVPR